MTQGAQPKPDAPSDVFGQLLKSHHPDLHRMIRAYSLSRFQSISRIQEAVSQEHDDIDAYVYGSHQAMILIASRDIKVSFKAHFSLSEIALPTWGSELRSQPERIASLADDFFREFANLTAGGIKQQLQACGIICGISLPIVASGYDEMIFSDTLRRTRFYDYWKIVAPGTQFTCTAQVDVFDATKISGYAFAAHDPIEDEGNLEFL